MCLVLETTRDSHLRTRLEAAISAVAPASVVLAPYGDLPFDCEAARPLVAVAQRAGVAVLIVQDADAARSLGADGVHIPWSDDVPAAYRQARESLGPDFIVGADAGRSRHDAMVLGEEGADYVGFGIPPHVGDRETAAARRLELVQWWAEIFEIPMIAFDVETPTDAAHLAIAGADFIAVRVGENEAAALDSRLAAIAAAVDAPEAVS